MDEFLTISQIDNLMSENQEDINKLHKQLNLLTEKRNQLYQNKEVRLYELFSDYVQIGYKHEVNRYLGFNGSQTGVKKGEQTYSPSFSPGDVIEFTKKNKKSIVITCLTKVISEIDTTTGIRKKSVINPNWTFRVDINSLYQWLMNDNQFKQGFESYVRRSESLDLLLDKKN
jgi:hypothetical protein